MIVVFDSGVWISAFQFGGTPLAAIGSAFGSDRIAYCDQIAAEIRAVLVRKFSWRDEAVQSLLQDYFMDGAKVEINNGLHGICRDLKDDMIFECAHLAGAKLIISGDQDLLAVSNYRDIDVLTPRQYLDRKQMASR